MATTVMLIRALISSTVTSPQVSYLTPMSTPTPTPMPMPVPTPMQILRLSSGGEIKQNTIILAEMSSIGRASIIRIIIWVAMPRLGLQQPSMMFASPTKLWATPQMSHCPKGKRRIECTNITRHGRWSND